MKQTIFTLSTILVLTLGLGACAEPGQTPETTDTVTPFPGQEPAPGTVPDTAPEGVPPAESPPPEVSPTPLP